MKVSDIEFYLQGDNSQNIQLEELSDENGIKELKFILNFNAKMDVKPLTLTFYLPALNVLTCYSQMGGQRRADRRFQAEWNPAIVSSRLSGGCPSTSLIDYEENNLYTISVSDVINPIQIKVGVVEEDATIKVDIVFFATEKKQLKEYEAIIRIDSRKISYEQALYDAESFLFSANQLIPCYVPDDAKKPVYSTWYSYHVNFNADNLLLECVEAKKLGIETIIVDDGWQMSDNNKGYSYCGDWEINNTKIPNIKEFVDNVHKIGMKVMFWFSIPFLGKNAKCFREFKNMLLDDQTQDYCVLDPRYSKVRNYLIEKYVQAIRDWGVDGLKLDFIDSFKTTEYSSEKNADMDYEDLYQALNAMMCEIRKKLQEINPNVMLEFRQTYIGPMMQTYGNMFRVGDCPCDTLSNRMYAIDMRLNMHSVAIHSDMLMWNYNDSVESAAKQLLSVFFTVPQISVRLAEIPKQHKQMLKHYLSIWSNNKDVLLDGEFTATGVDGTYSLVQTENEKKVFYIDFGKNICDIVDNKTNIYINVTANNIVYVDFKNTHRTCTVYDALGNKTNILNNASGIMKIEIPLSGMIIVET